jgi:hypothetical protein
MTQQLIVTTPANTGSGDAPKAAFDKINANFTDLYGSAGSGGAASIIYNPPFVGSVPETVAAKLAQTVSVLDFGADPTGATDITAAITLAAAAGKNVLFPFGAYLISSFPTIPAGVLLEVLPGATFSGSGAALLGFSTSPTALYTALISDANPSVNVAATESFVRLAGYTGGSGVHNNVRIQTNVGANVTAFEWGLLSVMNNAATSGSKVIN